MRCGAVAVVVAVVTASCARAERDPPPTSQSEDRTVTPAKPAPAVTHLPPATRPGGVLVQTEQRSYDGGYDGTTAVFLDDDTGGFHVALARDCLAFGCDSLDVFAHPTDAMSRHCSDGTVLVLDLARDPRSGDRRSVDAAVAIRDYEGTSGVAASTRVRLLSVTATQISGRLDVDADGRRVRGTFSARVCAP